MTEHEVANRFDAMPPGIEPEVPVPGYPNTWIYTPLQPPRRRPVTRTEATGPLDLHRKLHVAKAIWRNSRPAGSPSVR